VNRFSPIIRPGSFRLTLASGSSILKREVLKFAKKLTAICIYSGVSASVFGQSSGASSQPKLTLFDVHHFEELVLEQVKGGETWTEKVGKSIDLYYCASDELSENLANETLGMFERCSSLDCEILKFDPPTSPLPIFLYPDVGALDHAVGIRKNFAGGMSLGSWAAVIQPPTKQRSELEATGVHEIGLYSCPLFSEGLAFYLQGRFRNSTWISKPKPIEATSLTVLTNTATKADDFLQGARFISYLVKLDHGDPSRIKSIMRGLNKERLDQLREIGKDSWPDRVDKVFNSVYAKPLSALDAAWRATSYP
jgi:hypothetical protein